MLRKVLILIGILLAVLSASAQSIPGNDSTRYIHDSRTYGIWYNRGRFDTVLSFPKLTDTVKGAHSGRPEIFSIGTGPAGLFWYDGFRNFPIGTGTINVQGIDTVGSIYSLVNLYDPSLPKVVYLTDPVRGQRFFTYSTAPHTLDSGLVFPATAVGTGYWVAQYDSTKGVNIAWFGASQANADNSPFINSALFHYTKVYVGTGIYPIRHTIILPTPGTLLYGMSGRESELHLTDTTVTAVQVPAASTTIRDLAITSVAGGRVNSAIYCTQGFCVFKNLIISGPATSTPQINGAFHRGIWVTDSTGGTPSIADNGIIENCLIEYITGNEYDLSQGADINGWNLVGDEGLVAGGDCFNIKGANNVLTNPIAEFAIGYDYEDEGFGNCYIMPYEEGGPGATFLVDANGFYGKIILGPATTLPLFLGGGTGWAILGVQSNTLWQPSDANHNWPTRTWNAGWKNGAWSLNQTSVGGVSTQVLFLDSAVTTLTLNGVGGPVDFVSSSGGNLGNFSAPWASANAGVMTASTQFNFRNQPISWQSGATSPKGSLSAGASGTIYSDAFNGGLSFEAMQDLWDKDCCNGTAFGWEPIVHEGPWLYGNPADTSYNFYKLKLFPSGFPPGATDAYLIYHASDSTVRQLPRGSALKPAYLLDSFPTAGGTVSPAANETHLITSSGTITSLAIQFPANPADGDILDLKFAVTITTVTMSTTDGARITGTLTSALQGIFTRYTYDKTTNGWY